MVKTEACPSRLEGFVSQPPSQLASQAARHPAGQSAREMCSHERKRCPNKRNPLFKVAGGGVPEYYQTRRMDMYLSTWQDIVLTSVKTCRLQYSDSEQNEIKKYCWWYFS